MARKPKVPHPQVPADEFVGPTVPAAVTPVVAPVAAAATPSGPIVEYIGEGAELVKFAIDPRASKYVVNANGVVLETL